MDHQGGEPKLPRSVHQHLRVFLLVMIQPTAAPDFLGLLRHGGIDRFILRTNGRCPACKQAESDDEVFQEIWIHQWPLGTFSVSSELTKKATPEMKLAMA